MKRFGVQVVLVSFVIFLGAWVFALVLPDEMFEPVVTETQIQAVEADLKRLEREVMCLRQGFNNYGMQLTHCQPLESEGE